MHTLKRLYSATENMLNETTFPKLYKIKLDPTFSGFRPLSPPLSRPDIAAGNLQEKFAAKLLLKFC